MDEENFRKIVADAMDTLPDEFREALENIEIVVENTPNREQTEHFRVRDKAKKTRPGQMLLLGLYQGRPLGKRDPQFYSGVLPDKITLFKKSIEDYCGGDEALMVDQIRRTFLHEIGHYFGIGDKRLRELGY